MKIAVFDPFSGASGDMILGALIDAGAPLLEIQRQLDSVGVPVQLSTERVDRSAVRGTRVTVTAADDHTHRTWAAIRDLIQRSDLSDGAKSNALAVFGALAAAEATVHDEPLETVHFHEVGGHDAVADICGACIALELLGVQAVFSGPLRTGYGFVRAEHGLLPVPAPATSQLLSASRAPVSTALPPAETPPGELLTPTGAALLTTLAKFFPAEYYAERVGYGFGTRELPWPNALRVWIGETVAETPSQPGELVMETNVDDMSSQHTDLLTERLFEAGALDVWLTPIVMKKGRPAITVSALLPASRQAAVESAMIENSTTLGMRVYAIERTKAPRRFESVVTRWGDVTIKLRGWNGRVIDVSPEYDDCVRIARAAGVPFRDVWNEAHRFGESYVGRKMDVAGELR